MSDECSAEAVADKLVNAQSEVARLKRLLKTLKGDAASDEVAQGPKGTPAREQGAAVHQHVDSGKENGAHTRAPAVIRGSATSYLGATAQQDMNPGPKGKRSLNRGQGGVQIRKGQQQKGGVYAADCYEESMWDPKKIMPALGIQPIGHIRTCFPRRNGCPRQVILIRHFQKGYIANGSVVPASRAKLDLVFGSNPHHGLKGLEDFSHVWLVFLFDGNGTSYTPRPNVYPPRLLGKSKGVFATRSPHRPNPIGLSLCKIEAIEGRTLVMSGVDLVDGTPIIDVKPYIPCYDAPFANGEDGSADWGVEWAARLKSEGKELRYPEWCVPAAQPLLAVVFCPEAEEQLSAIKAAHKKPRVLATWEHVREAIVQVLQADPRSVYRKESCIGQVYPFFVDALDVRVEFADQDCQARIISVQVVPLEFQRSVPKAGSVPADQEAQDKPSAPAPGGGEAGAAEQAPGGDACCSDVGRYVCSVLKG